MKPVVHLRISGKSPPENFALQFGEPDLLIREHVISIDLNLL